MDVAEAVDRWVASSLDALVAKGFAQIDIDDLLDDDPPAGAKVALECLERMMEMRPEGSDLDGILTLPLEASERMDHGLLSLDDLLEREWSYGRGKSVLGLYLIHPLHWRGHEAVEEYRFPLESRYLSPRFAAYFRAWRDVHEPEFARCVYIRSVPD